jgi:uncharacterized surface protein with fasciclin (FAS1) repeats
MIEFTKIEPENTFLTINGYKKLFIYNIFRVVVLSVSILALVFSNYSCSKEELTVNFEDQDKMSIYDYLVANDSIYSSFLSILETGKIAKTLSAYNPNNVGYTLFLPDNKTIEKFIQEGGEYTSLEDMLTDTAYVNILSRYHIVDMGIRTDDFPFGALPEYTLSGDQLTVSFIIEPDTSYYKINNQAPVILEDIELSNGFIDVISSTLKPIVYTSYAWLENDPGLSIFKAAVDATGLKDLFDINTKDNTDETGPFTLFAEPDSIFNMNDIFTFEDLANLISPGNSDYTNTTNPLNNFIRYHMLTDNRFLDDFVNVITNYTTYSEVPLFINGEGLDIAINKGIQNFDTIISGIDTTIIDYISFNYDASNVLTQSGVIHFIDQVMEQQKPIRASQYLQFFEEPLFNEFRLEPGTYLVEDSTSLQVVKYSGADLFFVVTGDPNSQAWSGDYLLIDGDFTVSYTMPKLVQGEYTVSIGADAYNSQNALIEITIDGKGIGGLIDLSELSSAAYPFMTIELGTIDFVKYEEHTIEIKSLIPGRFLWDTVIFEPYTNN